MPTQVGYSLVDRSTGAELQFWGDNPSATRSIPDIVQLPNGDRVHAPSVGVLQGDWCLVPRYFQLGETSIAFNGEAVIVSYPVTADHVRAEAQRRIISISGANNLDGCIVKQLNALMRATELINKRTSGEQLSSNEEIESAALHAFADIIKTIRAKSNEIEAMVPIPSDFTADQYWT